MIRPLRWDFGGSDPKAPTLIGRPGAFTALGFSSRPRKIPRSRISAASAADCVCFDTEIETEVIQDTQEVRNGEVLPVHRNGVGPRPVLEFRTSTCSGTSTFSPSRTNISLVCC